ncbi:conserved hypothetical protein [Ricinus communis]|uniref:Uncharacterized protein n=1 Tax=Ricinus communis TaxID=3988 RepID=B9T605_RICCO|nr:conserved hypothetical protein [Ricinus communis]
MRVSKQNVQIQDLQQHLQDLAAISKRCAQLSLSPLPSLLVTMSHQLIRLFLTCRLYYNF